jgi:peptide/nickel transport system substrate-binding protein
MRRYRSLARGAALLAAGSLILAACGSGGGGSNNNNNTSKATNATGGDVNVAPAFNAGTKGWVNKSSKAGGSLNLLMNSDCDSWDPARTYYGYCLNLQRLFTRTLVGYASLPGANNIKLAADAATALGQHNADFTQWTYKIKPGVKWEDGTQVTSKDYKYGMERVFAQDVINGGPSSYFLALLKNDSNYKGPYKDKNGDLSGVTTPDDNTIVYKLKSSYADFDYLMTLSISGPVKSTEGGPSAKGATYTLHPLSTGPFKIQSYRPKQSIVFVRNTNWDQSTDTIRKPLVDKITITVNSNADDEDNRLKSGQADSEVDQGVQPTFQSAIDTDPNLKKNADDPITGFTRYLVLMPSVKPFDNIHCRNAVFYAIDKQALQRARGGSYGGDIATTMSPPTLHGYDPNANPYPNGADKSGDLTKAKSELKACGQPNGFSTKMAYVNTGRGPAVFQATQDALKKINIKVTGAPNDGSTYYSTFIGSPANIAKQGLGIANAGWAADFPTGFGFWNSIAYGKNLPATGNSNYSSLNDPVVNQILETVVKSAGTHDAEFKQLDAQVMKDAVMLPYVYDKTLFYRNPRLTNVTCLFAWGGYYDYVNMGVSDGK